MSTGTRRRGPGLRWVRKGLAAGRLLVPIDDSAPGQVVCREFDDDAVCREDADVVLPHLATDGGKHLVTVGELHPEHGVRECLDHGALQLECALFLRHKLS